MSPVDDGGIVARLRRYAGAGVGPLLAAGMQFVLSLLLLSRLSVADFGRFSFLIVVTQFGIGLWSALFGAPLLVAVAGGRDTAPIRAAATAALLPAAGVLLALALAVRADLGAGAAFGGYGALLLARQFARTGALAGGAPGRAILSDLLYGGQLAIGCAVLWPFRGMTLGAAVLPLLVAAAAGLLPFVVPWRGGWPRWSAIAGYRAVWRRDSRWSLLGVLSTEGTVNSHSYIVTAGYGAAAFAPIAASALLIRPITVAINALVEFERARFARDLAAGRIDRAAAGRRHLHWMLGAIWAGTLLLAAGVLTLVPDLLFHGKFPQSTIVQGTALWFAVALMRQAHAPEGALLLAAGWFRELASISLATAVVSLGGVAAGLALGGPLWSIAGIALGEGSYALLLHRRVRRFLREPLVPPPAA